MKHVFFLKAGTPYGYGYTADEVGVVHETALTRKEGKPAKTVTIALGLKELLEKGVVREANAAEIADYKTVEAAEKKAATPPAPPPAA